MATIEQPLPTVAKSDSRLTFRQRTALRHTLIHLFLIAGVVVMFIPLAWTLSTSLKSPGEVYLFPPTWIPKEILWSNYAKAVTAIPFFRYLWNTSYITLVSIAGKVISITLVAFSFARLNWRGRDAVFLLMLSTMMLPPHITLIPQFILFKYWGWIDTFWPLIVPTFFGGPWLTFLVRQYFMTLPRELDDAARIDGAGYFAIYSRILLPMSPSPPSSSSSSTSSTALGTNFYCPLSSCTARPISPSPSACACSRANPAQRNLLMAASLLTMLPVIILFFFSQRHFIQGIVFTGVKA